MDSHATLVLREDVIITPVADLDDSVRSQFECDDGDYAISRPVSRNPSIVVDAQAADLLRRFRKPHTIVETVILFSREHGLEPGDVLEGAVALVRRFTANQFLVPADHDERAGASAPRLVRGDTVAGFRIVRALQILDDVELHQVHRAEDVYAALKILHSPGSAERGAASMLAHEAEILRHLDGEPAPRLLGMGDLDGRQYLLLEWIAGVDAAVAGSELRVGPGATRREASRLCSRIVRAYARLHSAGVLHGDVHPRNVLVDRNLEVRLIDFGLAVFVDDDRPSATPQRGGIPFFYEPEYARALLEGSLPPPVTPVGEQLSVAALLFYIVTGAHTCDFTLERPGMLRQLAELQPLSFEDRGLQPFPALERILRRALSLAPEDRYPSMGAFAKELEEVEDLDRDTAPLMRVGSATRVLDDAVEELLAKAALGGPWLASPLDPPPSASVNYGAAGVAHALHRIAAVRGDGPLLATADVWASRAHRWGAEETGFLNRDIEITAESVGESSIYHSVSGVFVVQAMIAHGQGDTLSQGLATEGFLRAAARPGAGLDLTTGRASVLLGCSFLLDLAPPDGPIDRSGLLAFGDQTSAQLWQELSPRSSIHEQESVNLGIAHGWAGYLYASLQWHRASRTPPDSCIGDRLHQLAQLAEPTGRGLRWPWQLQAGGSDGPHMSGWCNGSAGYVFLWSLAYRLFGEQRFLDLATGASWDTWEAPDRAASLCCGLTGRAYALLNLYRLTRDRAWLARGRDLALLAATEGHWEPTHPHSLYKGYLAIPVLATDLQEPDQAAQPLFEDTAPAYFPTGPK